MLRYDHKIETSLEGIEHLSKDKKEEKESKRCKLWMPEIMLCSLHQVSFGKSYDSNPKDWLHERDGDTEINKIKKEKELEREITSTRSCSGIHPSLSLCSQLLSSFIHSPEIS